MTPSQAAAVVRCFWQGASLDALSQALDVPQLELEALLRADMAVQGANATPGPVSEPSRPSPGVPKGRRTRADVEAAVLDALRQAGAEGASQTALKRATATTSGVLIAGVLKTLVQRGTVRRQGRTFTLKARGARP